ncbi:MAG: glycogen/starch synthase [Candidatus Eisenbacteria bacterium]
MGHPPSPVARLKVLVVPPIAREGTPRAHCGAGGAVLEPEQAGAGITVIPALRAPGSRIGRRQEPTRRASRDRDRSHRDAPVLSGRRPRRLRPVPGQELRRRDHTVTVFLPRYPKVLAEVAQLPRRSASVQIPMGDSVETANLLMVEVPSTHVRIVWVGHPYFERPDPYVDPTTEQEWSDNADRWIFFAKAIVAGLEALELARI